MPVVAVLTATAGGPPDMNEVRRPQTGPVMGRIDKGLHKPWAVAVASVEIPRQATQNPPQNMTGQVGAGNPGPDQETAHAHHPVEKELALSVAPRHPALSGRKAKRRG